MQTLVLDQTDAELIHGKRIVIVDDVISTGESLRAMEELVNEAGGIIVGKMAVLAEGDANDRPDITVLGKLPLFNPDRHAESVIRTHRTRGHCQRSARVCFFQEGST